MQFKEYQNVFKGFFIYKVGKVKVFDNEKM